MKFIPALFALSLLLTACATTTSDSAIRRRLVGVWSSDSNPGKVIEYRSDGTVVVKMNGMETARGRWQVTTGYIIQGPAEALAQGSHAQTESNKVVSVVANKAVLLSIDGHIQLTFHRQ
jgi:hypothetical protein